MQVIATDERGNEFIKTVSVYQRTGFHENEMIIDFGWPIQYIASHLLKSYPFQKPLCIDMMGQNHKGSPVTISAEQMDKVIEELVRDEN